MLGLPNGIYRLVEIATGRELARLEDPGLTQTLGGAAFTSDGTRLLVVTKDGLLVWDLRFLRQSLKELDLDWDAPPYPEAPPEKRGPIEVQILGAELIEPRKMAEHVGKKAISDLVRNPLNGEAYFRLGRLMVNRNQPEPAFVALSVGLALRPDLDEAYYHRARASYSLQRWKECADDATAYLRRHADDYAPRWLRARAYREGKMYREAIEDCSTLLARYGDDPIFYEFRASCYEGNGQPEQAKAERDKAFALDPKDPRGQNNLAWRLVTGPKWRRDPARALKLIQEAIAKEPDVPTYLNTLGVVQYRNGKHAEASLTLQKSLATGKGEHDGFDLFFLAMCHAKLGDATSAKECFARAVKWVEGQRDLRGEEVEELKAFRAEAEEVLLGK
jgi:tetratricopeptide (TPR) repeat protein